MGTFVLKIYMFIYHFYKKKELFVDIDI